MFLDYGNPVNKNHPLNRGRLMWWLGMPNQVGGTQFHDLINTSHTGSFTNAPAWGRTLQGFRGVDFVAASSQYVTAPVPAAIPSGASGSFAATIYRSDTSHTVNFGVNNNSTNEDLWSATWWSDGNFYHDFVIDSSAAFFGFALAGVGWHRLVMTFESSTVLGYCDGTQRQSGVATELNLGPTLSHAGIGRDTPSRYGSGTISDFTIWNRALTAAEIVEDYRLSLLGYRAGNSPLNWVTRKTFIGSPPAAATSTGNMLLCF